MATCSSTPTGSALAFPVIWVPAPAPGPAAPPAPSVPALVQRAFDEAALVQPVIALDPPGEQVVFVPMWASVPAADWHEVTASAAAGPVTATVTAMPRAVRWTFGDGQSLLCPGPGVAYVPTEPASAQSTYCSHTWASSSASAPGGAFVVTASIEYEVTVTVVGAADATPDLGVHDGPSSQARVVVSEVEALGTNP